MARYQNELISEYAFTSTHIRALQSLLRECFPEYLDDRIFYKQIPDLRILRYRGDRLIGQVGVEHRVIRVGKRSLEIFGIVDLAVSSSCRSRGHGKALLSEVEAIARGNGVDGIMLFADDHRLYNRCYYRLIERNTTWLGIHEFESNGLITDILEAVHDGQTGEHRALARRRH